MKNQLAYFVGLLLALSALVFSCQPKEAGSWQKFMACGTNSCVAEAAAVKDAFLVDPKPLYEEFILTDQRGEDFYIGWLYLLRDSILLNSNYAPAEERFAMQQAIIAKAKEYESDPKYGDWSKSIISELEMLAIASELEDQPVDDDFITGTYAYERPNEAGAGEIKLLVVDEKTVRFAISVVGPPPAHNLGMMEGNGTLVDNVVTVSTTDFGGKCTITFTISGDQLVAKTLTGGDAECGFGHNITADGTYKMVDDLNPFAAEGGDESPAEIEGHWVSTTDAKFEVKIEAGKYVEIYSNEPGPETPYSYHKICPKDCNPLAEMPCIKVSGQDDICYTIVKADGKSLELSMIGGTGNTMVFKKKG